MTIIVLLSFDLSALLLRAEASMNVTGIVSPGSMPPAMLFPSGIAPGLVPPSSTQGAARSVWRTIASTSIDAMAVLEWLVTSQVIKSWPVPMSATRHLDAVAAGCPAAKDGDDANIKVANAALLKC